MNWRFNVCRGGGGVHTLWRNDNWNKMVEIGSAIMRLID